MAGIRKMEFAAAARNQPAAQDKTPRSAAAAALNMSYTVITHNTYSCSSRAAAELACSHKQTGCSEQTTCCWGLGAKAQDNPLHHDPL
jgi:hypothetical protein